MKPARFIWIALSTLISGCNGGIDSVSLDTTAPGNLAVGNNLAFTVTGKGACGQFSIDWGDDAVSQVNDYDFAAPYHTSHRYDGWGGGQDGDRYTCEHLLRLCANALCHRAVAADFAGLESRSDQPGALCEAWPKLPNALAAHSLVHVTGDPSPQFNFSCANNGCIYDPDGRPGTVAAAPFPFPGMREYSLVLRVTAVGQIQLFQGGKNASFTVPLGGHLEVCQNTDNLQGAVGGWGLYVRVDELGP